MVKFKSDSTEFLLALLLGMSCLLFAFGASYYLYQIGQAKLIQAHRCG